MEYKDFTETQSVSVAIVEKQNFIQGKSQVKELAWGYRLFYLWWAMYSWRVIQMALHFQSTPKNVDMFGNWVNGFDKKDRKSVLLGCGAVLWALWREMLFVLTIKYVTILLTLSLLLLAGILGYFADRDSKEGGGSKPANPKAG
jgi:hypothetical protein